MKQEVERKGALHASLNAIRIMGCFGGVDESRTRSPQSGNLMRYQLRYGGVFLAGIPKELRHKERAPFFS